VLGQHIYVEREDFAYRVAHSQSNQLFLASFDLRPSRWAYSAAQAFIPARLRTNLANDTIGDL
jgi:hypothetical protein